jgi:hypothetical protein
MSKDRQRAARVVEKFRKISEKEIERTRSLQQKSGKLADLSEGSPAIAQFVERLKQKELQASGDLVYAEQLLEQLNERKPKAPKGKKSKVTDKTV